MQRKMAYLDEWFPVTTHQMEGGSDGGGGSVAEDEESSPMMAAGDIEEVSKN